MKDNNVLVRCEPNDRALIRWAAEGLNLQQSEIIRQGLRIGIPILVKRMKRLTPSSREATNVRAQFKRPVQMSEILKATEDAH
jgi:hypothetical protein